LSQAIFATPVYMECFVSCAEWYTW